ncbi:MAG: carboxypeptidase M32 [Chitinophagaceae bacterium]|nr:MAG: carboxypeptidase M32 [Chitinophagaceae bacterium]
METSVLNITDSQYNEYLTRMNRIADLRFAAGLLQWDQETYLPPKGAAKRGQQIATLTEISHELFTNEQLGKLLDQLLERDNYTHKQKRNIQLSREDYNRQQKIPAEFVRRLSETVNRSFHSWMQARKENNFGLFAADLADIVALKKEEAQYLGYLNHPYDALLNEHDKGTNVYLLDTVFNQVKAPLKELLDKIMAVPEIDDSFLRKHYPRDQQWALGMELLKKLGYDFEAGRQDISEHPFSVSFNNQDVRITTRIDENDLASMTWSCIHELGHALYEQGLPGDEYGLPAGEAASYSIHESQSRLWENHVGRSYGFCQQFYPLFLQYFPTQLGDISVVDFYRAINKVKPSLIRTEADELTYHFHVLIRYELEKKLLEGSLETRDIPAYWKEQYKSYLGVDVPDDSRGCLQDVHWSHGSFGYFPTYSLGSFYAAQIFATAVENDETVKEDVGSGNYESLLAWLRTSVHQHGRIYTSEALCHKISGKTLDIRYFLSYLLDKYKKIYNF